MSKKFSQFYHDFHPTMEDFWGRRHSMPQHERLCHIFGRPVRILSNDKHVLTAVDYSLPLFSQAPPVEMPPWTVQIVVNPAPVSPGPPPDNLLPSNWFTGDASWLMIGLDKWGMAYVDLAAGKATAVLTPELAQRPAVVSLSLLNTILLNLCLGNGFAMLHASCLLRDDRLLILIAPHNTGKSTTALHLILNGYRLLSDSMIHISPDHETPLLCGFPTRRIKLRRDMLPAFPQLRPLLTPEQVRNETKYVLDLHKLDAGLVLETAVAAQNVELCLLTRSNRAQTFLTTASENQAWGSIMHNSLYYDSQAIWQQNMARINPIIQQARLHNLAIGHDAASIVTAVDQLWTKNP